MPDYEHQQIKELLQENKKVLQENHEILEKLHRAHKLQFFFKLLWILIIIGVPFWLYLNYFEPVVEPLLQLYSNPEGLSDQAILNSLPDELKELLNKQQ